MNQRAIDNVVRKLLQRRPRVRLDKPPGHDLDGGHRDNGIGNAITSVGLVPRRKVPSETAGNFTFHAEMWHLGRRKACRIPVDHAGINQAARWLGPGRGVGLEPTDRLSRQGSHVIQDRLPIDRRRGCHGKRLDVPAALPGRDECRGTGDDGFIS